MSPELVQFQTEFIFEFNQYTETYFKTLAQKLPEAKVLWESLEYSFKSGGKRFRPFLTFLVARAYGAASAKKTLPYALAVEMIHTYSLIHDDLPCMDNDDLRRGKPTSHKVFGEDIALLTGDAFLTQAFSLLATAYEATTALPLIQLLAEKSGALGMIAGQVLDMKSRPEMTLQQLELMHRLKTGALIEAAVVGSAIILANQDVKNFSEFGQAIGLAFQIKDDILDANDKDQNYKSFISLLGLEKTEQELSKQTQLAKESLKNLKHLDVGALTALVAYNEIRKI